MEQLELTAAQTALLQKKLAESPIRDLDHIIAFCDGTVRLMLRDGSTVPVFAQQIEWMYWASAKQRADRQKEQEEKASRVRLVDDE